MYDILIIGAGMAGMTAALYAKRNNKTVMLIEKEAIGGQIASSPRVENYPTIPSLSGLELSDRVYEQIADYVDFDVDKVVSLEKKDGIFTAVTEYGNTYQALTVIIANGVKHRKLRLPKEEEFIGNGISFCAVCDGAFYKDQDVILVGDGNTALQYSLLLSDVCKSVKVCTLFDKFFGDESYVKALREKSNVQIIHNLASIGFKGEDKLEGVIFKNTQTGEVVEYDCNGLFVAIGQIPDNKIFENLADLDDLGYFKADETCRTRTEGLFVAGDTRTKTYRQLTTAASDGATAALSACDYILKNSK